MSKQPGSDLITAVTDALVTWFTSLPGDGSDNVSSQEAEAEIAELLAALDKGDELERHEAALVRELMSSVNQRRAGVRLEN